MARTNEVTGAASGIGKATKELLEQRDGTVTGIDVAGSGVVIRGDSTR
jgi:NADP-dependent 3-hydroxy acid dehydrogenase YdfG